MNKKITALTLATILAASISLPAAMAAQQTAEVQSSVSFRDRPSTSSNVVRYLKKGEEVSVLNEVNDYWYQVQDRSGKIGYVSSNAKYIALEGAASGGTVGSTNGNAVIVASVSFRQSPATDASRIRYLQKGENVTVTGQPNKYWYEVRDSKGVKGYVSTSSKYIKVNAGQTVPGGGSNGNSGVVNGGQAVEAIIKAGMKYLGTPYEYGSNRNNNSTFDCSDFVRTAFRDAINAILPADSRQQGSYVKNKGNAVSDWHQLKRGDLMFFMSYKGTKASSYSGVNKSKATITHVGIYLGNGQILHTYSKESGGVRTDSIAGKHWEYRFLYGGSAL
ncbi:C40 family peptidase [Paenibacillus mendelii]|uniref:SH3 domain-containing protein n=1 Tax=Paenibacillus mendelii TaxID=206163 RepID=A0ABV6JJK8_9BACL|nr:SH3 domain-containing C40 family peptidase [Paenibacillus mendelii]MCQ6558911.1 C40 family peptidase [Paenibacillus mendelii]